MPMDPLDLAAIGADLTRLTELVRAADTRLPGPTSDVFRAERDEILSTFDGYLEPRIGAPDAPIVAAIVGASGVGKSTLLNSIAQEKVSEVGVVRPTTRHAMLWADASHSNEYWTEFVERIGLHLGDGVDGVLSESRLTEHLTIIDTPPLGFENDGAVAAQAVAISDLCIFVTTPSRYADGLAWDFLKRTRRRGIPILFVMNRLPPDIDQQEVLLTDLATRLHQRELLAAADSTLLFGIVEGTVDKRLGALEPEAVAALHKELAEVADPIYRQGLVDETVYATARMVAERARALTRPMAAELPVIERLLDAVAGYYETEAKIIERHLEAGDLSTTSHHSAWPEAAADLAGIVTRRAGTAAHAVASKWASFEEAAGLTANEGADLWRHGSDTTKAARRALDKWHSGLEPMLVAHARPRRLRWAGGRARAVRELWQAVLGGYRELPRWLQKKLVDGGEELIGLATSELEDALRTGLAHDAARFTQRLGSGHLDEAYAAIVDRADTVDARLDRLAGQIPESWTEPADEIEVVEPAPGEVITIEIAEGSNIIELGGEQVYHRIEPLEAAEHIAAHRIAAERDS